MGFVLHWITAPYLFLYLLSYLFNCMYLLACIDWYFLTSLYVLYIIKKE